MLLLSCDVQCQSVPRCFALGIRGIPLMHLGDRSVEEIVCIVEPLWLAVEELRQRAVLATLRATTRVRHHGGEGDGREGLDDI